MQHTYFEHIKVLLKELKKNKGHFVITNKKLDDSAENFTGYFCKLSKLETDNSISFEAAIGLRVITKFKALGFTLNVGSHFSKNFIVNTSQDINKIGLIIVKIFEEIYKVAENSLYEFDDQIQIVARTVNKQMQSNSNENQLLYKPGVSNQKQYDSIVKWIVIIAICFIGYYAIQDSEKRKDTPKKEAAYNEWNGSVLQAERYLKTEILKDPDSYESISWSPVIKINDSKEPDVAKYLVTNKYRAKNSFGGYVIEQKMFRINYKGNVLEVLDIDPQAK